MRGTVCTCRINGRYVGSPAGCALGKHRETLRSGGLSTGLFMPLDEYREHYGYVVVDDDEDDE